MTEINPLADIVFLDDATRPKAPPLPGVTEDQKEAGRHLVWVHDHLRDNMRTLRTLIERASAGAITPAEVASETGQLEMVANFRRFGNLCGQYCQMVNTHHGLEDQALFPTLARQSDGLRRVTERLAAEHVVVHELLVRLVGALQELAREPGADQFAVTREIYEALERVLVSHLGYEESEIGDALGYYGVL